MLGMTLGGYRIESELGAGGMGTVYLATDGEGGRVAIKVVHPHLLARPGFFKRFMREGEVGRQVDHENVVRTFDVDALEVEGQTAHFLVMEHVEGRTLREMLDDLGAIPEALLRELARQTAAGLTAIHAARIVHRDLKPENVLVTEDHRVRIMDLGVARLVEESVALTRDGQFTGSLLYASPEQLRSEGEIGPAADLYSLGVMLYELATGAHPFSWDSAARVIAAHLNETPAPASERRSEISDLLTEALAVLLAKEPEARFGSAAEVETLFREGERSAWWAAREREVRSRRAVRPRVPVRRETELLGRESELAVLRDSWRDAREGRGGIVLLEGEAGIGKTRLVDAFMGEIEDCDAHVLYGSYPPAGGIGGLSDAVVDHLGAAGLEAALAPYLPDTPRLVPAFAAMVKHEVPPTESAPVAGDALHAVFVQLLKGLAAEKPLFWVVEDLHFAEPESRKVALSLARAVAGHRALLLLTTRPGLPEEELAHFSRIPDSRRTSVGRLGARDVILLVQQAFKSEALAERLGAKIALKSDGVPFFVFEMIRGLEEGGFVSPSEDGSFVETRVVEEIEVPSAVRDLVKARLQDLGKEERAILDVAAVQGFEFDTGLVARVLERKRVAVLQDLAEIERSSGVCRSSGEGCRFDHHQIHEVLYEELMPDLRREYHSLVAEALAARAGDADGASGEAAVLLAAHHLRGSRPAAGLPFLEAALDHLKGAYRHEAAIRLSDLALALDELEGAERARVLHRKSRRLGILGRREEEREALGKALTLADADGDPLLRSRITGSLASHLSNVSRYDEARETATRALELAREAGDRAEEAACLRTLANASMSHGRNEEVREIAEEALEIFRDLGDREGEASAWWSIGGTGLVGAEYEDARQNYGRALAMYRETGNVDGQAAMTINIGAALSYMGEYEEALDHLERGLALARECANRMWAKAATGNLGNIRGRLGRFEKALDGCRKGLTLSREIADRNAESINLDNLACIEAQLGRYDEAREHAELALDISRDVGNKVQEGRGLYRLALIAAETSDAELAERRYEEMLRVREDAGDVVGVAVAHMGLGELAASAGRTEEGRRHLLEAKIKARECGDPAAIVLAACQLAILPGGDAADAASALDEHEPRLEFVARMQARFQLWKATGDRTHLEEAWRLHRHLVDHAPEEDRESMVENVPLHRDILAARETRDA
ncbi:MAG: serine/threonine-protein kinase [Planctomycetota bacterium]|jgi:tetratricopeptide (TPR) repeat protein